MQREARDDGDVRTVGSRQDHPPRSMEASDERQNIVPGAPHPVLRDLGGATGGSAPLGPSADELLSDRGGKLSEKLRPLEIHYRRVAHVFTNGCRARREEDQRREEY